MTDKGYTAGTSSPPRPRSVADVEQLLEGSGYLPSHGAAATLFLAHRLRRPLFLEGEPGVGKTEMAKTFAAALGARLIRLQCYEGIDVNQAMYDWNFARQMLYIGTLRQESASPGAALHEIFGPEFLIRRPLLDALEADEDVVLLIDEIDRSDDEFEAFLLEVLSEFQVTIPELGVIRARRPPLVILTSNRTREVHDALKRRCLYHWLEFPPRERELQILMARHPELNPILAEQICEAVERLRSMHLHKPPGIGESIDWAAALAELGCEKLTRPGLEASLGALLKVREDHDVALAELGSTSD